MSDASPRKRQRSPFVGHVDGLHQGVVFGWAATEDGEPCEVAVLIDGQEIGKTWSKQPRPDVQQAGQSKGLGGWQIDISASLGPKGNQIRFCFPDGADLPGSPVTHGPGDDESTTPPSIGVGSRYRGAIDRREAPVISGWSLGNDGEPAPVSVQINDAETIVLAADEARPDLVKMPSNGLGGWTLEITDLLAPGTNTIRLSYPDGSPLPGSPLVVRSEEGADKGAPIRYVGAIDLRDPPRLAGWSVASTRDPAPVTVTVNGGAPIIVAAQGPRPDLLKSLTKGLGGWEIEITGLLKRGENIIELQFPDGSGLPGSPVTISISEESPLITLAHVKSQPSTEAASPDEIPPMTLAEFDEISLDDLIDIAASGLFDFSTTDEEQEESKEAAAAEPEKPAHTPGVFSRLLGRFRRSD